ncbi:MAG: tetratricopeptide repeat protein [Schaalia odontolytica]|nr:tetratricopeptide repeat protein [Schaalia odontolytica]MDU5761205.1 tetratricopeptide repeat protein [Schaalia odontolytica]
MGDPLLMTVVGVGAALTKVFLRACDAASAADLVGDGQELVGVLSRALHRTDESKDQIERRVSQTLANRLQAMQRRYGSQSVDPVLLSGACTEVEIILDKIANDDGLLLSAVRSPETFPEKLRDYAAERRTNVESAAEPYFDELIEAVATQYAAFAPWSPRFQIEAFKSILSGIDEIRDNLRQSLQAHEMTCEMLGTVMSNLAEVTRREDKPSRVFFGSRPDVVAGDCFVPRGEQEQLNALIADPTRRRTVLVGMRGCGKTQLASALAQQCEDAHWSLVAWVNASSTESITSDLVELAKKLKIDTSDLPTPETIIRRCFDQLKSEDPSDRLIIFDNVENIDDLRGLVPRGNGLRVVATTTNNTGWEHQGWDTIKVEVFDRDKSINYLLTVTKSDDHDAADTLARRLSDLPLALAQAAATALNEDWTLTQYLRRLETHRSEQVIHLNPGDEYPLDVYRALRMAIRGALNNLDEGTRRAARRQLGALALLAESGVPTHWLDPMSEKPNDAEFQDHDRAADEDAHNALTKLIHRSIVQQSTDRATTMFHRLQAQVLRESWSEEEREQACESAATLLESVDIEGFPRDATPLLRKETRDLIEQLRALGTQKESHPLFDTEQIRSCLMRAFVDANELGLTDEALTLQHGVEIIQSLMGSAHSDVLVLQNNLATTYEKAGRLNEAITLFEQVLADRIRILGDKHPDTLASRNNLAGAYLAANRPEESIALYEQVLTDRIGILSDDHPDTLASRNNLAYAYQSIGCFTKAISQLQQVLADSIRILGEDHPRTLTARNNLAYSYVSAGKFTIATPIFEQVLADSIRILGEDHPHTLTSRNNLAYAYKEEGRLTEAIDLYEQVSANSIRVLGSVHPETLSSRNNLACAYAAAGRITEAITQFEQVLTDCTRILDKNHPLTKTVRENLEAVRRELEQQEEDSANEEREQED